MPTKTENIAPPEFNNWLTKILDWNYEITLEDFEFVRSLLKKYFNIDEVIWARICNTLFMLPGEFYYLRKDLNKLYHLVARNCGSISLKDPNLFNHVRCFKINIPTIPKSWLKKKIEREFRAVIKEYLKRIEEQYNRGKEKEIENRKNKVSRLSEEQYEKKYLLFFLGSNAETLILRKAMKKYIDVFEEEAYKLLTHQNFFVRELAKLLLPKRQSND